MRVGISVDCTACGYMKKPHGRSAPIGAVYCDDECPGYRLDPQAGCLWPDETADDFGYPSCTHATKEIS